MNKWTMRSAALLTTGILAAGLTACGGDDKAQGTTEDKAATQSYERMAPAPEPNADDIAIKPGGGTANISAGARGFHVKCVQWGVNAFVNPNIKVDGIFGAQTTKSVKKYQGENGLGRDGVVGPKTGAKLKRQIADVRHNLIRMGETEAAKPYAKWMSNCNGQLPG